jgi:hypothetical protein
LAGSAGGPGSRPLDFTPMRIMRCTCVRTVHTQSDCSACACSQQRATAKHQHNHYSVDRCDRINMHTARFELLFISLFLICFSHIKERTILTIHMCDNNHISYLKLPTICSLLCTLVAYDHTRICLGCESAPAILYQCSAAVDA